MQQFAVLYEDRFTRFRFYTGSGQEPS